jgi:Reverse transcriptase (RNA-dependent DNA polymerase)
MASTPTGLTAQFFLKDYDSTLFPLTTNRMMVERFSHGIQDFIQREDLQGNGSFLQQQRVFASKRGWYLRPTMKLDPVAEFFLYDFVYRNRSLFRKASIPNRKSFGFIIMHGQAESILTAYSNFKNQIAKERSNHRHYIYFDISAYFNHVYHHDLVEWAERAGASAGDVALIGKFLREIRGGESFDCLPQGLYPAKMIGSAFLSFLEESSRVHAAKTLRMMDDVWLFDDDPDLLISDFLNVQSLLSKRGLNINEEKSKVLLGYDPDREVFTELDEMKVKLLQRRRAEFESGAAYYDESDEESDSNELGELSAEEVNYLIDLLAGKDIQEEDAELVLALLRDAEADINEHLPMLIESFPGLTKRLYYFCIHYKDKSAIADAVYAHVKKRVQITEFQLFWLAKITEDILLSNAKAGGILIALYDHESATEITRAKVLEIPEMKFGMPDLREEQLRSGQSGWLAWSSAVGTRNHPKGKRNHLLKYLRRSSSMNRLVGEFVETAL